MKNAVVSSIVLIASLVAGQAVASAGDPDASSAAKKCKQPKTKVKGKCKFVPKIGRYTGGGVVAQVFLGTGGKKLRLSNTPVTKLTCTDGTTRNGGGNRPLPTADLRKSKFKTVDDPDFGFVSGKFTKQKTIKGTYTVKDRLPTGTTCAGPATKFKVTYQSR